MRKTRRQKITADLHRQLYSLRSQKALSFEQKSTAKIPPILAEPQKYNYLIKDISKTGAVTGLIIIAQLIFSFLLKNHLLTIPGISY